MKIERMTKGDWGNCKALFTVKTQEGVIIDNFKLIEKHDGSMFMGLPSRKNKQDEWENSIRFEDKEKRIELEKTAMEHYEYA